MTSKERNSELCCCLLFAHAQLPHTPGLKKKRGSSQMPKYICYVNKNITFSLISLLKYKSSSKRYSAGSVTYCMKSLECGHHWYQNVFLYALGNCGNMQFRYSLWHECISRDLSCCATW